MYSNIYDIPQNGCKKLKIFYAAVVTYVAYFE